MGFYKDGAWQPDATEVASGEYSGATDYPKPNWHKVRELEQEIERLRKLLRDAAEHTRHTDYEGNIEFEREVWAALEAPNN